MGAHVAELDDDVTLVVRSLAGVANTVGVGMFSKAYSINLKYKYQVTILATAFNIIAIGGEVGYLLFS